MKDMGIRHNDDSVSPNRGIVIQRGTRKTAYVGYSIAEIKEIEKLRSD